MRPLKIAFASKLDHAEEILKHQREGLHFISRWLYMGEASKKTKPTSHWLEENFEDIKSADYVICFAKHVPSTVDENLETEVLKTALVEVGWAMAWGRPVIVIGTHESYSPWRAASHRVTMLPSLEAAMTYIKTRHTAPQTVLDADGNIVPR
jgi:hypothetical protein